MPVAVGVKVTDCVTTPPAGTVRPSDIGTADVNTLVGALAFVIVTGIVPSFVTVNDSVDDAPTGTLPKSRVGGLNARRPIPVTAVPVSGTVVVLDVVRMAKDPVSVPAAVGL